jgi:hypothetical protein
MKQSADLWGESPNRANGIRPYQGYDVGANGIRPPGFNDRAFC